MLDVCAMLDANECLCIRYSSDDTDDDTSTTTSKKKKAPVNTRRQTLANPMPPPSPILISPDANVSKSPAKNKGAHSEFKDPIAPDYDNSFTSHTLTKTTQTKYMKTSKTSSVTDGLETGSDSDVVEEKIKSYSPSKYLSNAGKSHDPRMYKRDASDPEQISKLYDSKSRSIHTIKDNKYSESLFDSNISPIQSPVKEDVCAKDNMNQRDILANYETPFLSEFTRRLSSRSSINLPASSSSSLKSKRHRICAKHTLPRKFLPLMTRCRAKFFRSAFAPNSVTRIEGERFERSLLFFKIALFHDKPKVRTGRG